MPLEAEDINQFTDTPVLAPGDIEKVKPQPQGLYPDDIHTAPASKSFKMTEPPLEPSILDPAYIPMVAVGMVPGFGTAAMGVAGRIAYNAAVGGVWPWVGYVADKLSKEKGQMPTWGETVESAIMMNVADWGLQGLTKGLSLLSNFIKKSPIKDAPVELEKVAEMAKEVPVAEPIKGEPSVPLKEGASVDTLQPADIVQPERSKVVEEMVQAEDRIEDIDNELTKLIKQRRIVAGAEMEASAARLKGEAIGGRSGGAFKGQSTKLLKQYGSVQDIDTKIADLHDERATLIEKAQAAMPTATKKEPDLSTFQNPETKEIAESMSNDTEAVEQLAKPVTGKEDFFASLNAPSPHSQLDDSIHKLHNQDKLTKFRMVESEKAIQKQYPDMMLANWERMTHKLENPNFPLTPRETEVFEKEIIPRAKVHEELHAYVNDKDPLYLEGDNYAPGFVKGKGNLFDRLKAGWRSGARPTLIKSVPEGKHRVFWNLVDENGNKAVGPASINKGKVNVWFEKNPIPLGTYKVSPLRRMQFKDYSGKTWKIDGWATKLDIEKHTHVEYWKNALSNLDASNVRLAQAKRAIDLLESWKADPSFKMIATDVKDTTVPKNWRGVALKQFTGYKFEPRVAAVLDRYYGRIQRGGDAPATLTEINDFLRTSIFFNPLIHIPNIATQWTIQRGLQGLYPPNLIRGAKTTLKAIEEVWNKGPLYQQILEENGSLHLLADAQRLY